MHQPYRVLIADDHPIVLEGIRSLLTSSNQVKVVAEVKNAQEAIQATAAQRPDVIVLDIAMPGGHGLDALTTLKHRFPDAKVVMHTVHTSPQYVHDCLAGGVKGYVVKGDTHANILTAIHSVLDGKVYLSPSIAETVVDGYLAAAQTAFGDGHPLTPREREILRLSAQGLRAKEIARRLELSAKTVENHRYRLMKKLRLRNRSELYTYALEHGFVEPADT